jgi:hypothetical protein
MREIPSLQVLCLRAVGGHACNTEDTFAKTKEGQLSTASRLLRSFHQRRRRTEETDETSSITQIPIPRTPAIGTGSARRKQAAEVDLNHPWIGIWHDYDVCNTSIINTKAVKDEPVLYSELGSPALDVLQSFVDSLVELGRMDDARLGLHFFQEWKAIVEGMADKDSATPAPPPPRSKKRRKSSAPPPTISSAPPALGSLSLYNSIILDETIEAMVESQMMYNLAVLDLTGIQTLNDPMFQQIVTRAPHLQRLSIKNCRRLTSSSLECMSEHSTKLQALDIGGSYNLKPPQILELIAALPALNELHASGLGWTDALLQELTSLQSWKRLSLGFLPYVTAAGFKQALVSQSASLQSLAIPFCEHVVDAALLGVLGRHLPELRALDVRGNSNLSGLTGWYDGRATIVPGVPPQPLTVLARYSGISKSSLEDTKRIHPLQAMQLTCIIDMEGVGTGIQRQSKSQAAAAANDDE